MLSLFLKQRCQALRNVLTFRTTARRLPFILIGAGFWVLLYAGAHSVLAYLHAAGFLGEALSDRLFSMLFFSLTGFLVLSNIITALSTFYLSREIPFLLSKPLEVRDIIRLKTTETIFNSSWMVLSFIPPVFIAYGVVYHATSPYYASVAASLFLLIVLTAGIGISFAHLLALFFPPGRSRALLFGLGLVIFLSAYYVIRSAIPHEIAKPEDLLNSFMHFRMESPLLPGWWISQTLLPALKQKAPDLFYAGVLAANSAFFILLSSIIGARLFTSNHGMMQPSGRGAGRGIFSKGFPGRWSALGFKDLKVFTRDTGQWSQVFIIAALAMVYVYNFRSVPLAALSGMPYLREIMVLANLLLSGLVLSAVSARFLYTAVSLEGQAFWVLKAGPVDLRGFLRSKFLQGCLPVTILICLLVFLTNYGFQVRGALMYLSLAAIFTLCVSVSAMGAGLGAMFPRFRYENIAAVSMGIGGMTFMILSFSLVLLTLSGLSWIYVTVTKEPLPLNLREKLVVALVGGTVLLANVAAVYLPMRRGARSLERMEL